MFRDTYKSAMDDIKPDSDLLATILSHADEKKRPLFARKWIYSVGACAASFLLVTCSVIGYNKYCGVDELPSVVSETADKNRAADDSRNAAVTQDLNGEIQQGISSKEITDEKMYAPKAETKVTSSTAEKRQSGDKMNEKPNEKKNEKTLEKSERNETAAEIAMDAAADSVVCETSETTAEQAQIDVPMAFAAPSSENESVSGSSAAKKAAADDGVNVQSESTGGGVLRSAAVDSMTVSQYAEYIGIDVAECLPRGFAYNGDDTLYVGTDGSTTQLFESADGRTVNVTLTKDCLNMKSFVESSSLERLTDTAVCDEYDNNCTVYGYGGNIGYIISGNLTKNEMKRLAESISK